MDIGWIMTSFLGFRGSRPGHFKTLGTGESSKRYGPRVFKGTKKLLGIKAKGRKIIGSEKSYA